MSREIKYCRNCGETLYDRKDICSSCGFAPMSRDSFCPVCGVETENGQRMCTACQTEFHRFKPVNVAIDDSPSFLFALIGFFVPIAGLIIFIVLNQDQPKKARSAGKGALTAVILSLVITMLFTITPFFFFF